MAVIVNYLGVIAEATGLSDEEIEMTGSKSGIIKFIAGKYPEIKELSFVVSHNDSVVHEDPEVQDGDRISLIPPPPGG